MHRFRYAALGLCLPFALAADWPQYAGDARRSSLAQKPPQFLDRVCWRVPPQADEEYVWQSTPVVVAGRVYVLARVYDADAHVANRLLAHALRDGERLWESSTPPDSLDNWASPAVHAGTRTAIVCAGNALYAFDSDSGAELWTRSFSRPLINASPAIADVPLPRAFIVDYTPFGTGHLYAINLAPMDPPANPHAPGDVVWQAEVARTGGNSPSVAGGVVYCATNLGRVLAFDASSGTPRWDVPAASSGFFGGVTVRDGFVFAASYRFSGGANNSELVKLDGASGDRAWAVACERTDTVPVVVGDGRILLSGGISGFGSAPRIQAFLDHGDTAELLWDTYADSDGSLVLGGWTHQPACGAGLLFAGAPDTSDSFSPYVELRTLDINLTPASPEFIRDTLVGAGGSPAVPRGVTVSLGRDGLVAIGACDSRTHEAPP